MTIGTEHTDWQRHKPAPDPKYKSCSPNIAAIFDELAKRWGCTDIGCYGWRPIRGGTLPSSHGFGAARDARYDAIGRFRAVTEIIPWLIDNSGELHLSAFHDYIGCRIWHAGRTANVNDRYEGWWQAQPVNPKNGMGSSWATYFHFETTIGGWSDYTPIPNRVMIVPDPIPIPDPIPLPLPGGPFVHKTIKLGDINADVYALQMFAKKYAGNTNILIDGKFGPITDDAVRKIQAWYNLTPIDGIVGPKTWAQIDLVANSGS